MTKREAFQILLAKFRAASTDSDSSVLRLYCRLISCPAPATSRIKVYRKASVPYLSIKIRGSMPLLADLDIFLPFSSLTKP